MNSLTALKTHSNTIVVCDSPSSDSLKRQGKAGFTLIEAACSMVILLVALIGISTTFTYAVNYNAGNSSRAQALAILQQEVEVLRSKKFTPTPGGTDDALLGGEKSDKPVTVNNSRFLVKIKVDNNPLTEAVEDESYSTTMKQITVTVTLDSPTPGWQTAVPATVILRRVRSN